jgi:hypothetical protein
MLLNFEDQKPVQSTCGLPAGGGHLKTAQIYMVTCNTARLLSVNRKEWFISSHLEVACK